MKLILNFLPIVVIFLLVYYSEQMARVSHTVLGKLVAVGIIIFYTTLDIYAGLLVCGLVILFYQSDYVEGFAVEQKTRDITQESLEEPITETLEVDAAYPESPTQDILYDKKTSIFRKKHCKKGHLIHKGQIVKPEMQEHVFPEIEQHSFHKCNICDSACDFDLLEKKLDIDRDLTTPKSSNDIFVVVWENLRNSIQ